MDKENKIWVFPSWVLFGFLCLFGVGLISDSRASGLAGVVIVVLSLFVTPPIKQKILEKIKSKGLSWKAWHVSLLTTFLIFIFFVMGVPKPSEEEIKQAQTELEDKERVEQEIRLTEAKAKLLEEERLQAERNTLDQVALSSGSAGSSLADLNQSEVSFGGNNVTCRVVGVHDGDTATCLTSSNEQIKIRFDQIDAPELGQDFGAKSKQALSDIIYDKQVEIIPKEEDKYGRTVAEVFIDSQNVNKQMVALGMAWAYREYMRDSQYQDLENKARKQLLGLWSQPNPVYPSDFRKNKSGEKTENIKTEKIQKEQNEKALSESGGSCGSKQYCKQMTTCAEAQHYLKVCGVHSLDKDDDGVPCEKLCR